MSVFLFGLLFFVCGILLSSSNDGSIVFTNAIAWCCIGLVVGLMTEVISSSRTQHLVEEVKHSDLCKKLVDADREEIMAAIRTEAEKATPDYRPDIYIETGLNNIRLRAYSWEYRYLTRDEAHALMLAIGNSEGYLVKGKRGCEFLALDDEYWWPIIEEEIDKVQEAKKSAEKNIVRNNNND